MSSPSREVLVAAGLVVTPDPLLHDAWVLVSGDRILEVGCGAPPRQPDVSRPFGVLVPGFVDAHVHGGGGASFASNEPDQVARAAAYHLSHGTTSVVASLVSAPVPELLSQVGVLAELAEAGIVAGIHLEGPWLNPLFKGAHDEAHLCAPDHHSVDRFLDAGRGWIRMVTLAPELENGLAVVRRIAEAGIVPAVGHTACDYDTARSAIDAGVNVATHLFNAMPSLHHRDPGPVLAVLEDPRVVVELILDNVHLDARVAAWAMRGARGGYMLVTDAMAAAGASDGRYRLGNMEVHVRRGVATLPDSDVIAGSTLTLHRAMVNAVRGGLSLGDAVRASSTTPSRRLGLGSVGRLTPGHLANLVVLNADLEIDRVMLRGHWVAPS